MKDRRVTAPSDAIDPSVTHDAAIFSMLREWYYDDSVASTIGAWAAIALFWFGVWGSTDGSRYLTWALTLCFASALLLLKSVRRFDQARWFRRALSLEASVGVLWGSIMLIAPPADPIDQMFVSVLLNAVVLAAAVAMGQFFKLFMAFSASVTFTSLLGFWLHAPDVRLRVTLMALVIFGFSASVALQQSQGGRRLASSLLRNERLADDLSGRNDALEVANSRLDELAHTDALTRLHNRFSFEKILHADIQKLIDGELDGLRLAYLDVDRFKAVNDTLGHRVGDKVLQVLAQRLLASRISDDEHAARLGGDEMVLLAAGTDAGELGSRLLQSLGEPIVIDGKHIDIGVSVGVATTSKPTSPDVLIREADIALYEAKFAGGDRYAVAGQTSARPARASEAEPAG